VLQAERDNFNILSKLSSKATEFLPMNEEEKRLSNKNMVNVPYQP
jgi:hypothetical protein